MAIATSRNFLSDQQALRKEKEAEKAKLTAKNAAALQEKMDRQQQLDDENRVFDRAKQGLDAKTDAQLRLQRSGSDTSSRLQSERAGQSLQSQREGVEGSSRLQRESAENNSRLQNERASQSLQSQRTGIEGNSRLQTERATQSLQSQREGIEGNSRLQSERAGQSLRSQETGIEGNSRLQREGSEQRSKLQTQAAAETAARRAGDRAAAMASFSKFGKGR